MRIVRTMRFEKLKKDDNRSKCPFCNEKGFKSGEVVVFMIWDSWNDNMKMRTVHFDCWYNEYGCYMPSTKRIGEARRNKFMCEV